MSRGFSLEATSTCSGSISIQIVEPPKFGEVAISENLLTLTSGSDAPVDADELLLQACLSGSRCSAVQRVGINRCSITATPLNLKVTERTTTSIKLAADSSCGASVTFELITEPQLGAVKLLGESDAEYTVGYGSGEDRFKIRGCDSAGAGCSEPEWIVLSVGAAPSFQGREDSLSPYRENISAEERQYLARKLGNNRFDLIGGDAAALSLQELVRQKFLNPEIVSPDLKPTLSQIQSRGLVYGRPDSSEEFIPGWQEDFSPSTTCASSLTQSPEGPNCFQPIIPQSRSLENPDDLRYAIERWRLTSGRSWHSINFLYHWGHNRTASHYLRDTRYLSPLAANMSKFWAGHFGTNTQVVTGLQENLIGYFIKTIEREVFGNFRSMMLGVPGVADDNGCAPLSAWNPSHGSILCDAASNIWLSNDKNTGQNQDFARELMELYLLSPTDEVTNTKNYTDIADVVSVARFMSGFKVTPAKSTLRAWGSVPRFAAVFDLGRHDFTSGSVFSELAAVAPSLPITDSTITPGGFVAYLFQHHPGLARFIAGKLFSSFVYPDPSEALVAELGEEFKRLDFDLGAFLQKIFTSEAMFSPRAALGRNCISSPLEVYSRILNSVNFPLVPFTNAQTTDAVLGANIDRNFETSGEVILGYPTVFGYDYCGRAPGVDGSTAWLFSHLQVFRITNFIRMLNGMATSLQGQYDLSEALGVIRADPEFADGSPESVIGYFQKRFALQLNAQERAILLEFLTNRKQESNLTAVRWNPDDTSPQGKALIREKIAGLMVILAGFEQSATQ